MTRRPRAKQAVVILAALLVLASAAMVALSAVRFRNQEPKVWVEDVVVEVSPAGNMAEAYFTLRTNNDPTKLVGVSTPAARSTELRARSTDGSRRLRTGETTFDPRHPLIFSRRGNHLVIHEPVLRAGDRVPLTFHVEPAPPITVNVEVRAGKPQGLL